MSDERDLPAVAEGQEHAPLDPMLGLLASAMGLGKGPAGSLQDDTVRELVIGPGSLSGRANATGVYTARLRGIWQRATPESEWSEERWEWFRDAVLAGLEPLRVLSEDMLAQAADFVSGQRGAMAQPLMLEGNLETVALTMPLWTEQLAAFPDALLRFTSTTLADAIERFEMAEEGTPEERVDLVLPALHRLATDFDLRDLAKAVLRNLLSQSQRGTGYALTLGELGNLAISAKDDVLALIVFHLAMREAWKAVTVDEGEEAWESVARLVEVSAMNTLLLMVRDYQRTESGQPGPVRRAMLDDLLVLSAVSAATPAVNEGDVGPMLAMLGLSGVRGPIAEHLAVLAEVGAVTSAVWDVDALEVARLQMCGTVAAILIGERTRQIPSRFFNTGVTLLRPDARPYAGVPEARVLLNAAGLEWALQSDTLLDALLDVEGIDNVVNLMGAIVDLREDTALALAPLRALARQLSALSSWPELGRPAIAPKLGRIHLSTQRLKLEPAENVPTLSQLREAVSSTLELMVPDLSAVPPSAETVSVRMALMTRAALEQLNIDLGRPWQLYGRVQDMVDRRGNPRAEFVQRYGQYSQPLEDPFGTLPIADPRGAGETGFLAPERWRMLREEILVPLPRLAPSLRRLSGLVTQ